MPKDAEVMPRFFKTIERGGLSVQSVCNCGQRGLRLELLQSESLSVALSVGPLTFRSVPHGPSSGARHVRRISDNHHLEVALVKVVTGKGVTATKQQPTLECAGARPEEHEVLIWKA